MQEISLPKTLKFKYKKNNKYFNLNQNKNKYLK
jgi:hypothetical protein